MPGGKSCTVLYYLNIVLTIRSYNEWNVITLILPFFASKSIACSSDSSTAPNSSLTAMRIAWKIRFAGCPPLRLAGAGIAVLIISTSSPVVSIGCFSRTR